MTTYILGIPSGNWSPQLTPLSEEQAADLVEFGQVGGVEYHFTIMEVYEPLEIYPTVLCSLNAPCGKCRFCQGPDWEQS